MSEVLEPRQERYARLVASGVHQVDAHKEAGYKYNVANAYNLAKRANVSARIEELQKLSVEELAKIMGKPIDKKVIKKQLSAQKRKMVVQQRKLNEDIEKEKYLEKLKESAGVTDLESILILSAAEITPEDIRAELLINLSLARTMGDMPSANRAVQMLAASAGINLLSARDQKKRGRKPRLIESGSTPNEKSIKPRTTPKTSLIDSLANEVIDSDGDSDTAQSIDTRDTNTKINKDVGNN